MDKPCCFIPNPIIFYISIITGLGVASCRIREKHSCRTNIRTYENIPFFIEALDLLISEFRYFLLCRKRGGDKSFKSHFSERIKIFSFFILWFIENIHRAYIFRNLPYTKHSKSRTNSPMPSIFAV